MIRKFIGTMSCLKFLFDEKSIHCKPFISVQIRWWHLHILMTWIYSSITMMEVSTPVYSQSNNNFAFFIEQNSDFGSIPIRSKAEFISGKKLFVVHYFFLGDNDPVLPVKSPQLSEGWDDLGKNETIATSPQNSSSNIQSSLFVIVIDRNWYSVF